MLLRLFLLFTLVPLADLLLLVMISKSIPIWASVVIIVGSGMLGAWLAKKQWQSVKGRIHSRLSKNQVPGELITDGMLVLLAGGLLIAPGFITDAFGMSLLIPVCRRWYKKKTLAYLKHYFDVKVVQPHMKNPDIVDGEVVHEPPKPDGKYYSDGSQFEAPLPTIEGTVKNHNSAK